MQIKGAGSASDILDLTQSLPQVWVTPYKVPTLTKSWFLWLENRNNKMCVAKLTEQTSYMVDELFCELCIICLIQGMQHCQYY